MRLTKMMHKITYYLALTLITTHLIAQNGGYMLHTILKGETLSSIAKENKVSVGDIMRLNKMNTSSILKLGASIKLPIADKPTTSQEPVKLDANLGIPTKPTMNTNEPLASTKNSNEPTTHLVNTYKVVKGDNLYKLSKQFKVTEAQLMDWNELTDNKLSLGQTIIVSKAAPTNTEVKKTNPIIKTPLTSSNYTVVKGDNLYKLSKQFGVTEADLMKWNGLPNNNLKLGQLLIIKKGSEQVITDTLTTETTKSKPTNAILTSIKNNKPDSTKVVKQIIVENKDTSEALISKPKIESKKDPTLNKGLSKLTPVEEDVKPIPKYEKYVANEGYYAAYFDRKAKDEHSKTGLGAIIKSASGWSDKKFFVLTNELPIGKIVRVTVNNKSICAKVIGELPNVNGENHLLLRINSAAAKALEIQETRFTATINYK